MHIGLVIGRRGALMVCAILAAGLAACGGGDGDGEAAAAGGGAADKGATAAAPAGSGLEVVAKDIAFEPAEITVGSAPAKITLRNEGAIVHTLVIEGAPGFGKLEAAKGASDTGTLDLAPGTYTAFCDQPGHRAAGMEAKLTVG
jgi:plastocyanin